MDRRRAEENLELIRTLMERATRYEYLSSRVGLIAGGAAVLGSLSFLYLDAARAVSFAAVWGSVFAVSVGTTLWENWREVRAAGETPWARPARQIARALVPALVMALALTVREFARGHHLGLPGVWMLCYGTGALATTTYAPPVVAPLGIGFMAMGLVTLWLGPGWANVMMGLTFGGGHLILAATLLHRREHPREPGRQPHLVAI